MYLIKKIAAFLLCFSILCCFAGCGKDKDLDVAYHTDRYIPSENEAQKTLLEDDLEHKTETVDWKGPNDYVIVVPKGDANAEAAAEILKGWF